MVETLTATGDFMPCQSHLEFSGRITRKDGSPYSEREMISLTNRILYLYDSLAYRLQRKKIETVCHPGQTFDMLAALPSSRVVGTDGFFSCTIQLRDVFGFCRSHEQAVRACEHSILLRRRVRLDDLWRNIPPGTIEVERVRLFMKNCDPSDQRDSDIRFTAHACLMFKINERTFTKSFRLRRPNVQSITVALQNAEASAPVASRQVANVLWLNWKHPRRTCDLPSFDRVYTFNNRFTRTIRLYVTFCRLIAPTRAYILLRIDKKISLDP